MYSKQCAYCGKIFTHKYLSQMNSLYCSITCSNKARIKHIALLTCPICGTQFKPKQGKRYCSNKCVGIAKRVPKHLKYPGLSQYEAVSKHMRENNPMHNPETVERVKRYWEQHPNERQTIMDSLMAGHQQLQKNKPTKLELRLRTYLDQLHIVYEPSAMIKDKFIVDIRIGNLIIEADGNYWHGHPRFEPLNERQLAQQKRDRSRNAYLTKCGYIVVRIWESDMSFEYVHRILKKYGVI